jgi:hypothetical protein
VNEDNSADVVGKVFIAVSQDVRRCLICDGVFTTRGAAEHTRTICHPSAGDSGFDGGGRKCRAEKAS